MDGVLLVNKPRGISSAGVIAVIKRTFGKKKINFKIGHGGTLDPEAQGLLLVGMGKHTKVLQSFIDDNKVYETTINLLHFTTTDDVSGEKEDVDIKKIPTMDDVVNVITSMIGDLEQIPSKYSAIKINGRRAYDLARKGEDFEMKSRTVKIYDIDILVYDYPNLTLKISCSKGTYIRTIGRDIGKLLGTGGYLTELIRLKSGVYFLDNAFDLDKIQSTIRDNKLESLLIKVDPVIKQNLNHSN